MSQAADYTLGNEIDGGAFHGMHEAFTPSNTLCTAKLIKLPMQQMSEFEKDANILVKESEGLCSLEHKNLVKIFGIRIYLDKATVAMYMDYISGRTLEIVLRERETLSEEVIKSYSKQICSALEYLHKNNVVHRNINSSTVMIEENDLVRLIDYGMSVQLLDASFWSSGCSRGPPQYMAPELCPSEPPLGAAAVSQDHVEYRYSSDIWAFGCIVYEMSTGKRPHADCGNMFAIGKRIHETGAPELPDTCSDALRSFYAGCVVYDRHKRTSAAALLEHEFIA